MPGNTLWARATAWARKPSAAARAVSGDVPDARGEPTVRHLMRFVCWHWFAPSSMTPAWILKQLHPRTTYIGRYLSTQT